MRRLVIMLVATLVCVVAVACVSQHGRLLVEQTGPVDGALRPFVIQVGPLSASTRDIVYVNQDVFNTLFVEARRMDNPQGAFRLVFEKREHQPDVSFALDRDGLARLMVPLVSMFRAEGMATPAFLVALAVRH